MALNIYMTVKGQKQGDIKGSCTQKGREDKIEVFAFSHDILSPRDAASGLPTGKRQHKPLGVVKEIDKSTPLLFNALVNNESLTEVTLQFWKPSKMGKEVQFYTIKLTGASISEMRDYQLDNKIAANMPIPPMETVAFCYQKIEWTWMDGGIMASDDWEAPEA